MTIKKQIIAARSDTKRAKQNISLLKKRIASLEQHIKELTKTESESGETLCETKMLQLGEVIIANSPAILFRRRAAEDLEERKMVYVSPNISRFGYQAEDFLEDRIMFREIVNPEDHKVVAQEIQDHVNKGKEGYSQIYQIICKNGELRWVEDRTSVVEDEITGERFHQGIIVDIHEKKIAEDKLRRSEEKYRRIVDTAGEGFLLMNENLCIVDVNDAFAKLVGKTKDELYGTNPFTVKTGEYRQYLADCKKGSSGLDYREFESELLFQGKKVVPVLVHANTLRSDDGKVIGNMAFVTDLTQQQKALELAGEVQRGLLPAKAPDCPGVDIAGRNVPCDKVGGDYFDFILDENDQDSGLSIVVGDITGHGVDAALLMSSARAFLRMLVSQTGTPVDIVTDLNKYLTQDFSESGRFMTMFYLFLDRKSEKIEWIRAGHDPALLYDPKRDSFEELKGPGLALGVEESYNYLSQCRSGLRPGQVIILGTDGIWESCNANGEMFGKDRLMNIVRNTAVCDASMIVEKVFEAHTLFTDGLRNDDDLTLVVVKILPL